MTAEFAAKHVDDVKPRTQYLPVLSSLLKTAYAAPLVLVGCLYMPSAADAAANARYKVVMSKDDVVCAAVEAPLNKPPAILLAPFSMRDVPPFSNVKWDAVTVLAGGFKEKKEVARIALNDNLGTKTVVPSSTVFPNGTFNTWLDILPFVSVDSEIQQAQISSLSVGRIETQQIKLRALAASYPPGFFGSRSADRPWYDGTSEVTTVNDFDLLAVRQDTYLFMRTYELDDARREKPSRRWAIVSKFRALKVADNVSIKSVDLEVSLEHVCYFVLSTR